MRLSIYQHFLQLGDKSRRIPGSSSHQICNGLTSGILSEPYRTFDICCAVAFWFQLRSRQSGSCSSTRRALQIMSDQMQLDTRGFF